MTHPTHSIDDQHRRRYGVIQHASGSSASGPPITLPDEAPEVARENVPDDVLSHRTSPDGAYGIVFWLDGGPREAKIPDGVTPMTHSEMREHMQAHADIWEPEDTTV